MAVFTIPMKVYTGQHESMDEGQAHEAPGLVMEPQAFNGFLGKDSQLSSGTWSLVQKTRGTTFMCVSAKLIGLSGLYCERKLMKESVTVRLIRISVLWGD